MRAMNSPKNLNAHTVAGDKGASTRRSLKITGHELIAFVALIATTLLTVGFPLAALASTWTLPIKHEDASVAATSAGQAGAEGSAELAIGTLPI